MRHKLLGLPAHARHPEKEDAEAASDLSHDTGQGFANGRAAQAAACVGPGRVGGAAEGHIDCGFRGGARILPLHWGYIPVLLAIEGKHGKAEREQFQKRAIEKGWTVPELRRVTRGRLGINGRGRNPRFTGSASDEFENVIEGIRFLERRLQKLMESKKVKRNQSIHAKCQRLVQALHAARSSDAQR
jgi:hypothetical protein